MAQPTHTYRLKWAKMASPKVRHLAFEREDGAPFQFKAGQFITLHIEGPTKVLHRSYSIANAPEQSTLVEIACSYVEGGVATNLLFNLQPGDPVLASGPYGIFVLKEERPSRYILISTGTGVTPYRSMLNEMRHRFENTHPELEIVVIFGTRTRSELLFKEEFLQFAQQYPRFRFLACYSQEKLQAPEAFEREGYVQSAFEELRLEPTQDIIYLCGNPNMIDETFALLTTKNFDKKNVRREKYLFSH